MSPNIVNRFLGAIMCGNKEKIRFVLHDCFGEKCACLSYVVSHLIVFIGRKNY